MIRRLLWLGVGVGIGVAVVRLVTRKAQAYTPSGLARTAQESVGHAAGALRSFVDEVREQMADREYQIRSAFAEGVALDEPELTWAEGVGERFGRFAAEQSMQHAEQSLPQEGEQHQ